MVLRNTNAYDMIENSRLKSDSKMRTNEKKVKQIKKLIAAYTEGNIVEMKTWPISKKVNIKKNV